MTTNGNGNKPKNLRGRQNTQGNKDRTTGNNETTTAPKVVTYDLTKADS
jgi:hypothetical protein